MKRKFKVRSNKWYGWFWPPERRKIKILQAIVDYKQDDIEKAATKTMMDKLIFGVTEQEAEKWKAEDNE